MSQKAIALDSLESIVQRATAADRSIGLSEKTAALVRFGSRRAALSAQYSDIFHMAKIQRIWRIKTDHV